MARGRTAAPLTVLGQNVSVPRNSEAAFAERTEVYAAWVQLNGAIKARMDLVGTSRDARGGAPAPIELLLPRARLGAGPAVRRARTGVVLTIEQAGLDDIDGAVMDLAEHVVDDATSIGDDDLRPLRALGLSETEIMDVVLAASARCFFSKTLDALGVLPDASYAALEPDVREALVVGRPIADA